MMETSRTSRVASTESPHVRVIEHPRRGLGTTAMKRLLEIVSLLLVLPRLLLYQLNRRLAGPEGAFAAASESIGRIPGARGVYLRQAFYRRTLRQCGQSVYFGWQGVFSKPDSVLADQVYIGRRCSIGWAEIGAGAMLADGVQLLSGGSQHGSSPASDESHQEKPQRFQRVSIGAGAWLGTNAIVMADVGEATIVGAGAVVTHPLPANVVAVGVPARVVKRFGPSSSADA